jgi:Sugar phosphate isomerases/epimerases
MKNILSCSTHCYNKFSFERALRGISDAGLKYVEIGAIPGHCDHVKPELLSKDQMKEVLKKIESYGLEPSSISGHCDLVTKDGVELFKKRVDFAVEIGVGIVNTAEGKIASHQDEIQFFENMKEVAKYLEERNVIAALETHGGILASAKECINTINRIGSKNIKINYDPANLIYFDGKRPEKDIADAVAYIGHFHIKDKLEDKGIWNFPAIGDGYIDFKQLFNVLQSNNYEGPLSFEIEFVEKGPRSAEEVDEALVKSVKHVKTIIDNI